jgi:hypothetical protein
MTWNYKLNGKFLSTLCTHGWWSCAKKCNVTDADLLSENDSSEEDEKKAKKTAFTAARVRNNTQYRDYDGATNSSTGGHAEINALNAAWEGMRNRGGCDFIIQCFGKPFCIRCSIIIGACNGLMPVTGSQMSTDTMSAGGAYTVREGVREWVVNSLIADEKWDERYADVPEATWQLFEQATATDLRKYANVNGRNVKKEYGL